MKSEKGLLYFMNGNLQMAKLSTSHMIEKCPDEKFRGALLEDLHSLEKFENALLSLKGTDMIKPISGLARVNTEFAIDAKMFSDDGNENMRRMLAKGYRKGVRSISENISRARRAGEDPRHIELACGYLRFLKERRAKYEGASRL